MQPHGMHSSLAQRFLSRRTRSMLRCKTTDYTPQVQAEVCGDLGITKKLPTGY